MGRAQILEKVLYVNFSYTEKKGENLCTWTYRKKKDICMLLKYIYV